MDRIRNEFKLLEGLIDISQEQWTFFFLLARVPLTCRVGLWSKKP